MAHFHNTPKKKPGEDTPQKALDAAWHSDDAYALYITSRDLYRLASGLPKEQRLLASKIKALANEAEQARLNMMRAKK